jgi:hypothetical protein
VSFTKGRIDYNYDGIVSGLDNGREYRPRNSRGGFDPPVKTDVLTLVSSSGQVEEHLQEADKLKLRAHRDLVKKEKDLLAKAIEGPTGGMTPGVDFRQQQMRMTPFPGPGGMPPGMMRGRGFRGAPGGMYGPMGRPTDGRDYRDRR